jgi:RNA polymerase sigma-70 factor (ECF subfamily)
VSIDDSDAPLVARCLTGDRQALATLVERYQRPIYNLAYRLLGDRDAAEDVAQAAFLKAMENLERFDPRFKFFSWLYRIAMNEALDQLARRNRLSVLEDEHEADTDPVRDAEVDQHGAAVQGALATLSADHRAVIVLRHFSELSYEDISTVLEVPEKTVRSRLFEARERLRQTLERRGYTP